MGLGTGVVLLMFSVLILLVVISVIHETIYRKKNPHLVYDFIAGLGYNYKEEEPNVIEVNEKLKLHFSFEWFPMVEIYAKNHSGNYVLVENRIFGFQSVGKSIKFEQPWHEEISRHLRELYMKMEQEEQKEKQEKQNQIETI